MTASAVLLVPWIVYLAFHLPTRYAARHWNVAWVGFDIALLVLLSLTALAAAQRRQALVPLTIVSADVPRRSTPGSTSSSTGAPADVWWSLASALLLELPLALFLLSVARRIVLILIRTAWERGGNAGPPPRLLQIRITQLVEVVVYPQEFSDR